MKKLVSTLACLLALTALGVVRVNAQTPSGRAQNSPLRLGDLTKSMLPAPEALTQSGIAFCNLSLDDPAVISVALYDGSRSLVATGYVTEEGFGARVLYRIKPVNGTEEWIRVTRAKDGNTVRFSITSSDEGEFDVRVTTTGSQSKGGATRVASIDVYQDGSWTEVPISELKVIAKTRQGSATGSDNRLQAATDRIIFTTPGLRLLGSLMRDLSEITKAAVLMSAQGVAQPSRGRTGSATLKRVALTNFGCTVSCIRVQAVIPLYACDGGGVEGCSCPQGSGLFLIACDSYLVCILDCGSFGGGAIGGDECGIN